MPTSGSTGGGWTYGPMYPGVSTGAGVGGVYPMTTTATTYQTSDRLTGVADGWRFVEWEKPEGGELGFKVTPIIAIRESGFGQMGYVLAGSSPYQASTEAFVCVLAPTQEVTDDELMELTRAAYAVWKADQVAKRILTDELAKKNPTPQAMQPGQIKALSQQQLQQMQMQNNPFSQYQLGSGMNAASGTGVTDDTSWFSSLGSALNPFRTSK